MMLSGRILRSRQALKVPGITGLLRTELALVTRLGLRSLKVCRAGGPEQHLPFFWQFRHVGQVSSCKVLDFSNTYKDIERGTGHTALCHVLVATEITQYERHELIFLLLHTVQPLLFGTPTIGMIRVCLIGLGRSLYR